MAEEYLGSGNDDGEVVFRSGGKGGFYGTTPIVKPSGAAQAAGTTDTYSLTASYNSAIIITSLTALLTEVNALRSALVDLGLIAGE